MKNLTIFLTVIFNTQMLFAGGVGVGTMGDGDNGGGSNKGFYYGTLNNSSTKNSYNSNFGSIIEFKPVDINKIDYKTYKQYQDIESGIIYYQGESTSNIYFQTAKPFGSYWHIEQHKVQKGIDLVNAQVYEALTKSKRVRDWQKIQNFSPSH